MKPLLLATSLLISVGSTAFGQTVVFRSTFEYPNGDVPAFDSDMNALNGAVDQVGLWSGELPTGLGEGQPKSVFMRVIGEDRFFIIDRPEASMVIVATPSETVPIAGTRVSYQFSTKRVGGHAKDTHVVGLDAEGRESFHVVASADSATDGERLRLGVEANGGELIWDLDTVDGEDNDGDFPFNNSTGNTNNVGTVVLDLQAEGYVMTVSKGLDNFLYKTALLPYNDPEATGVATVEFRANGGGTGVSSGLWLDDVIISHSEGVSDPGLFVERAVGFGRIPQSDEVFEKVLAISNEGETNTLTISGVSTSGANPDNFAITDFPESLGPGEAGELTVIFDRKGGVGEFSAMLVLATNDPDAQDQSAIIEVTATVPAGGDTDGDGLTDAREAELGSDPGLTDTDGDGLGDGQEVNDLQTSPLEVDTDGDGFGDGEEVAFGSDPTSRDADSDMDGLTDEEEFSNGANPGVADTDGDTLKDGEEVNGDPPTDPALADTDGDSLADNEEKIRGTNPTSSDSDGDTLDDGFEILLGSGPNDIDSPVEGGGTAVVFQSGFEFEGGLPKVGLDARNLNGAIDQLGSFSGEVPEADLTGGLLDGETISEFDLAGDTFILVDRPLAPHVLTAELVSPIPLAGATLSFEYATRRTGGHPKDVSFVGIDDTGNDVFEVVVSAKSDPPDGQRLGFRGPDVDGELVEPTFDFDVVAGEDLSDDLPNVGANPGVNGVAAIKVFLLAEGYAIDYRKPGRGYRTTVLPYRNAASTLTSVEIRVNGGGTGVSSGFYLDDFVVESAGKPSDPNIIASPRVNLGPLAVTPAQLVSVRLLNTGASQPLNISDVTVGGQNRDHFTVSSFPPSILPGEEGFIELLFDAELRSGPVQAILSVATDDPDVPTTQIELTAVGVDLAGPVAHFSLDEPVDTPMLVGISKNALSASVEIAEGSVTLGAEELASGSAAAITGNASIRVGDESITELDALSVSLWVNVDAVGAAAQTLFAKGDPPSPNIALITLGGDLAWFVGGDAAIRSETGSALVAGKTHHVVAVYSDERAAIYVDGVAVVDVSEPEPVNLDVANAWFFGGFGSLPFSGRLDDIQLYDRGLVASEVVMLRDSPGQPLTSGAPVVEGPRERFAQVQVSRSASGNMLVSWLAAQDVGYLVEFSNDLQSWETIEDTRFSVQVNDAVLEDANAERTQMANGYYRVVLVP